MFTVDVTTSDDCLRIVCAGGFGPRAEDNLLAGRLIQNAINSEIDRRAPPFAEVVIDFTRVEYGAGDGPIWSVMGAVKRGLKVTYVVGERTRGPLQSLLSIMHMEQFIALVVVGDTEPGAATAGGGT